MLPEESQRVVKALRAAGGAVKFTLYRNAGHDSWTPAYACIAGSWSMERGDDRCASKKLAWTPRTSEV